jgi:hypothetical protein
MNNSKLLTWFKYTFSTLYVQITNSTEQDSVWKANISSIRKQIPRIL